MDNISEIILGSLSQIWHLIPIAIAIILIKKFVNKKDTKRILNKHEENEKKGLTLELRTRKKYEELGYAVTHHEIEDEKKELGIDLLCSRDDKTLLVQCNNYSKSKSITAEDIKIFHSNAVKYAKTNDIEKNDVEFRYAILFNEVLDKSAINILEDDSYNCKYIVV